MTNNKILFKNRDLSIYLNRRDIESSLKNFFNKFEEEFMNSKIIYLTEVGSGLHGTSSDKSDIDLKGIYLPSIESIIKGETPKILDLGKKDKSKNSAEDIDVVLYPLDMFFNQITSKMEPNALEVLFSMFSDKIVFESKESVDIIRENHSSILYNNINTLKHFAISMVNEYTIRGDRLKELNETIDFFQNMHLSKKESKRTYLMDLDLEPLVKDNKFIYLYTSEEPNDSYKKYLKVFDKKYQLNSSVFYLMSGLKSKRTTYGKRVEKALENDCVDYKSYSHAVRAIRQAKDLINDGFIKFPLPYADYLKELKYNSTYTVDELSDLIEEELFQLNHLEESKVLNKEIDLQFIKELRYQIYKKELNA